MSFIMLIRAQRRGDPRDEQGAAPEIPADVNRKCH